MGKKKVGFVDRQHAQKFRLLPGSSRNDEEKFHPTAEQLKEQHEAGIFFDDDYDYLKHLKSRDDKAELRNVDEEEKIVIKASTKPDFFMPNMLFGDMSQSSKKAPVVDEDIDALLNGDIEESDTLEDNFLELAGGVVDNSVSSFRSAQQMFSDEEDDEEEEDFYEDEDLNFNRGARYEYSGCALDGGFHDDDDDDRVTVIRDGNQREMDDRFDQLLEADYNDDQMGELDTEECNLTGVLEPNDPRILKMLGKKRGLPEYDAQLAREMVRQRMKAIEERGEQPEQMETVEIEDSSRKRMKWDCESFATQYTNIYNHPTIIKETSGKLSTRALKRLDKMNDKLSEEGSDCEMEEDDVQSVMTTVSTIRPKGETPEERRLRKSAVKEAQRVRREEKKINKLAFAEEAQRLTKQNMSRGAKSRPIL